MRLVNGTAGGRAMVLRETAAPAALARFLASDLDAVLARPAAGEPERRALALFRSVAATVPAYQAFLAEHRIDPAGVATIGDFRALPLLTKDNYLRRHPLPQLCRDGELTGADMVAVSSGSTGEPTFWPRSLADEFTVATRFEQVFHDSFGAAQRTTLAVVCFALGTWVGGVYTASCCRHLAAKGYPITVITPGSNVEEILRVVTALGGEFEQVVLLGYPPFLKGVVDTGRACGVPWPDFRVKLVLAGEVFSEEWRTLLSERLGGDDPCSGSASLYGTADAGVLAAETPLSIRIRRYLAERPALARELFGQARLPTLAQYDPLSRLFETRGGTLLFTGDGGIPLIRYHIADTGGLTSFDEMLAFLAGHGFDPITGLGREVRELPFVHVFGRSMFTVSYYGANIYPENVTVGLEQAPVAAWVTGKFVMESQEDADRDRHLAIAVELAPGVEGGEGIRDAIARSIAAQLRRLNSEFAHYTPPERQLPRVTLHPSGDPGYFPPGVKHRYSR
ncbi:MAG TPA: phenylacetate--CoA ligase family protein [Pseudonocardiaceae bacterium]|nr:phenylacetate--CoA ligase family protein [Pseudonocardiaceae bacterium]